MYLKRFELQGYKSFARKTEFVFEDSITAIVGPNGSGKSNVADAVRWTLGETRMSQLRAKVTDDLIFAGSDSRARLGMAQVTMTLDNSDETLPIDYSEVTIERRAYRDGQNEYLINGTKVRLRDIVELLAAGGLTRDAYSVIGQGLVDTVLSLRPQERRALIDVAAGIRPLQDKRDRALSQLDETKDNLRRVRDISAEIAPRLRRLEKQAERARQGTQVAQELAEALKTWYGYQWHTGQQALRDARRAADAARETLKQRRQALTDLEKQIESRRDREESQADALSELRQQRAELRGRYEAIRRDLAVREERLSLLQRRQNEITQEIAELRKQRAGQQQQLRDTDTTLVRLDEQCQTLERQLASVQQQQSSLQQRKVELEFALEGARQKATDATATLSDYRNRLATLTERRAELTRERTAQEHAIADLTAQIERREADLEEIRRRAESHERTLQDLAHNQNKARSALGRATRHLTALRDQVDDARRQLERLQARRDALAEMRQAGSNESAGAQALLAASDELGGIVGSAATLLRVPAEHETAVEAALGPDLHAVVVEDWPAAQRAIAWLRTNQVGRASLIVLEGAEEPEGARGVASRLVACDPEYESLVRRLLGNTVIAEDVGGIPPAPITLVTPDGTVVQASGRVTAGAIDAKVLRRERLWRELPEQIRAAEADVLRQEAERAEAKASVDARTSRLSELEKRVAQAQAARAEAQSAAETARRDVEAAQREIDWRQGIFEQRGDELETIQNRISDVEERLAEIHPLQEEAQRRIEHLRVQLEELAVESLRDKRSEIEKQLALARRDQQNQQGRQLDLQSGLAGTERQIENKRAQLDTLSTETEELESRIRVIAEDEEKLSHQLEELEAVIAPAEEALRTMRREGRDLERQATHARERLRQAETAVSEASLNVQRREDRLTALRDRIADDLELAAVSEELPQQLVLDLEGEAEQLPRVTEVPEGLERRVKQLRRQMRQLGSASPEIIQEYKATRERYDFLTSQTADLEEAAADLREVAAELTEKMAERFDATLSRVAGAFEKYFSKFFGGGEAHLFLSEEEEDSPSDVAYSEPGLEITARPPGKRSQSLALLSGGERALTAVALLFALLEVSPTPFCVLDEVDAMLDEANIGRFRATLEDLAEDTQFVIITHNRGTIQAADTVYGISMGDEGVSQAISLKMDELQKVPA